MKFFNTLIDIVITAVCMGIVAGFAYLFYINNSAQDLTFLMPALNSLKLDMPQVQGYAIAIIGVAIGARLLKAAVNTDHTQMA